MAKNPEPGEAPWVDYDEWVVRRNRARHLSPDIDATLPITPYPRRRDWTVARHSIDRPDWNQVEGEKQYLATSGWTVSWYAVPYALLHSLPKVGVAVVVSVLFALLIRLGSGAWRPITTAFSAAVIGAGAATILFSVLTTK